MSNVSSLLDFVDIYQSCDNKPCCYLNISEILWTAKIASVMPHIVLVLLKKFIYYDKHILSASDLHFVTIWPSAPHPFISSSSLSLHTTLSRTFDKTS